MKKLILKFNFHLILFLVMCNLFNYAFHEYAALEIDMMSSKYYSDPIENEKEAIIVHFMNDFKEEARKRNINVDYSRLTYSIHKELGREQAFLDRNITIFGSCQYERKHLTFREEDISPQNMLAFRSTVFHELAHCVLGMSHTEHEFTENGIPNILADFTTHNWNYEHQGTWDVAVNNLFQNAKHH